MIRSVVMTFLLLALPVVPAPCRGEELPERATVTATEALVRSGPGDMFYPTGRLAAGEQVEIYRRHDDGWCAIRPPQGSFSYVRADHVRPTEADDILEVTQAGTKTRVGSSVQRDYRVEYVALKAGERLQLLGAPVRLGRSRHAWYRVAPPSGEFRWVRARDLDATGGTADTHDLAVPTATVPAPLPPSHRAPTEVQSVAEESPNAEGAPATAVAADRAPPTAASDPQATDGMAFEKLPHLRNQMHTEPIAAAPAAEAPPVALAAHAEVVSEGESAAEVAAQEPSAWTVAKSAPLATSSPAGDLPTADAPPNLDTDLRLAELELALSRTVTQEVDRWNLEPLSQQVREIAGALPTDQDRRDAQQLLERIEEFAVIQRRHRSLSAPTPAGAAREISLSAAVQARPNTGSVIPPFANLPLDPTQQWFSAPPKSGQATSTETPVATAHYAGQGFLVPVVSSHPNLPRFALTDAQGAILAFVSPRPGLNLRRYVRREVGIVGRETARSDEHAAHLVADRVVVLDRHQR